MDTIYDILNNPIKRLIYIESFQVGYFRSSEITDMIEYIISTRINTFKELDYKLYPEDDKISELIIPSAMRTYGKFFIKPSPLLKDKKLDLYENLFNVDEYIDNLIYNISIMKNSLEHLIHLNRTSELISLIVNNYVSEKFEFAYNCNDVEKELRDIKLRKLL